MPQSLAHHLNNLSPELIIATHGNTDIQITAPFVESSLDVQIGGVFMARKGASVDGHKYILNSIENGAVAIIGESSVDDLNEYNIVWDDVAYIQVKSTRDVMGLLAASYHDFPSRKLTVIGITGTNGKTTTSHLLHSILKSSTNGKTGFISTIAADFGGVSEGTGLHVTTPDAPQVQAYLDRMVDAGLTHVILEMTSHGLHQGRLVGVDIDIAVLTNITHEHLDYHGSFENYRLAKGLMFDMLHKSYRKPNQAKVSVINADDPSFDFYASYESDMTNGYSIHADSTYQATNINYQPNATHFKVGDSDFSLKLIGDFNIHNALATISVARALNINDEHIQNGFDVTTEISGRMERIDEGQDFTAIVDFAHTPDALEKAIAAARTMLPDGKRLIVIFGSAGLRDVEKRRMMAETSAQHADITVLTAEDPRTESLDEILQMMADGCIAYGGVENKTFFRIRDRGKAIFEACQMANAGDIVMACGKGHEQSMCFGTIEYDWDDRNAMRHALRGAPLSTLPTAKLS